MTLINLTINGRSYEMTCDDGQEPHLQKLADYIDDKVRQLAASVGQAGDQRLLLMASLLIADELFDAHAQIHARSSDAAGEEREAADTAAALDACAQRIEAIAARLAGA
ncbi:MAG: cell division protein ZapA [Kiloniellaceae bacterium]